MVNYDKLCRRSIMRTFLFLTPNQIGLDISVASYRNNSLEKLPCVKRLAYISVRQTVNDNNPPVAEFIIEHST